MRVVVQRCLRAEVRIAGETVGQIGRGFLLLVGVTDGDTTKEADLLAKKVGQMRVFEDADGKMTLDGFAGKDYKFEDNVVTVASYAPTSYLFLGATVNEHPAQAILLVGFCSKRHSQWMQSRTVFLRLGVLGIEAHDIE